VRHQVGVDPVDDAGINVSNLKERWDLGVPGTTIHPDHVSHSPGTIGVSDDHRHSGFDAEEDWICFGRCNGACMINRHASIDSTHVLAPVGRKSQRGQMRTILRTEGLVGIASLSPSLLFERPEVLQV